MLHAAAGKLLVAALVLTSPAPAPDTLHVGGWLAIGPFPSGSREAFVEPIWPRDPAAIIDPAAGDSMPSPMIEGGWVHWSAITPKGDTADLPYDGVNWDALTGQWGAAGTACSGLLYGTLEVATAGCYLIDAPGIGGLYIDGRRYLGNAYTQGTVFFSPVRLDAGKHRILLRASGMGPRKAAFRLLAERDPIFMNSADLSLPDLVANESLDGWGAVPIINCTGRVLRGAVLRFGDGEQIRRSAVPLPPLEPEAILKVPFLVQTARPIAAGERCREEISIQLESETYACPCSLRVREPHATRRNTFRSRQDGSIQRYGVLPPSVEGGGHFALILSLHGAGVDADGQVGCYAPKDWAYVVAPTNTRPFGFDWQDWGRRNAIETLEDAMLRYSIDSERVLLTGHSMGGHGTWVVGLSDPGRFAALAPSAGWGSFETYMPFTLRRDASLADPRLLAIWKRALGPDNPYPFMRNLRSMPIYVLQGGADEDVPPMHARMLSAAAREAGARVTYREVPKMTHWWDDPKTPGVDCVDLPAMMDSLRAARRIPHPREVSLRTADLGTCDRSRWLVVEEALHAFDMIAVDARFGSPNSGGGAIPGIDAATPTVEITTAGARALAIAPLGLVPSGKISIRIDGQQLQTGWREGEIHLRLAGGSGKWKIVDRRDAPPLARRAPIKAAYFEPFVLVYGTGGSAAQVETMRRTAVLDAQAWYQRADGYASVLPDTAVTSEMISGRNLVLYATPGTNAILERIASRLPIRIETDGITLAGRRYAGEPLAARYAYPNPLAADRLIEVVAGTGVEGLQLAAASNPCYSASGYPDFVVYGADVRRSGWGGMRAAGFFDSDGAVPEDGRDAYLK